MVTKYEKANRSKLLVAVMAMAVVLAGAAVIFSDSDLNASDNESGKVAMIGDMEYDTLGEAINSITGTEEVTIKLLRDATGNGIVINNNKNVIIDFDGHTYTVGAAVGSTGTETNAAQLLKGSTVTFMNGTLTSDPETSNVKRMIQNYCDLTLDNMVIDGSKMLEGQTTTGEVVDFIAIASNFGEVVVKGDTEVISKEATTERESVSISISYWNNSAYGSAGSTMVVDSDFTGDLGNVQISGDEGEGTLPGITIEAKGVYIPKLDVQLGTFTVSEMASASIGDITVAKNAEVSVDGELTADSIENGGIINVTGSLKANIERTDDDAKLNYTPDSKIDVKIDGETLDVNWSSITLTDGTVIDADSSIYASSTQQIIIDGDVMITAGGTLSIEGKLIVNEGATLTLEEGSKLLLNGLATAQIDGEVIVEAGADEPTFKFSGTEMTINGMVTLNGANSFESTGKVFISGVFEISDDATAVLDGAVVSEGGELIIFGVATTTEGAFITNNGTITVDSQGINVGTTEAPPALTTEMTVQMGDGAVIDVTNLYGIIIASDSEITYTNDKDTVKVGNDNGITLSNVSGVVVTEALIAENGGAKSIMSMSGTITEADSFNASEVDATISTIGKDVQIIESMYLGEGVTMTVGGKLTVTSELTATATGSGIMGVSGGIITVTGKITTASSGITGDAVINASLYDTTSIPAYKVYTTLETALSDGAVKVKVLGENTVESDLSIPVGTEVTMDTGAKLTVKEGVTLTVDAADRKSGKLTANEENSIIVNGTLIVMDFTKSGIKNVAVLSDTKKESGSTVTFTNIYDALENAADGETITITRAADLTITKDITIKDGVTLAIPARKNVIVDNDVTVTVDGVLKSEGSYTMKAEEEATAGTPAKNAGKTIVNGMLLANNTDAYTEDIIGAYFGYDGMKAIAPLASVPEIINDIEGATIDLYGNMDLGDVDLSAYTGNNLTLNAKNILKISSLTIGKVKFNANTGSAVTGTVVLANGSVALDNIYGVEMSNAAGANETVVSTISGSAESYEAEDATTDADGKITVNGAINSEVSTAAKVSFIVADDAEVNMTAGALAGDVEVNGIMNIGKAGVTFVNITILGDVTVTENVASATVSGKLLVGVTADDFAMAGTASVAGMTLSSVETAVAYVSPNATVVGDSFDALKSTEYYVDDVLYLTAYAKEGNSVKISDVKIEIDNTFFKGWLDSEGNAIDTTSVQKTVGQEPKVYADLRYDIYNVEITVDSGIGSIAIDGVVLEKTGNNKFSISGLVAGQHTITYQLKAGFNGDDVKLTVNGESVTGFTITLSGNPVKGSETVTYQLSLSGTTTIDYNQGGSNDNGGMTLVEILLIVLVVMVVILAIVVILRMMRS